jgi:hypothetical protein
MSRRARSRSRQQKSTLPDWVWGLGLGVIVLIFVGAYFALTASSGTRGSCDSPLPPLGASEINAEAFAEHDAELARIQGMLNAGDVQGANAAFYGRAVHNFTHNIDPQVRKLDEELAKNLCRSVIELEETLLGTTDPVGTALLVQRVRSYLADSAEVLGYPRPAADALTVEQLFDYP